MRTERQLSDDFWLCVEAHDDGDEFFVLDGEGDVIFKVPEILHSSGSFKKDEHFARHVLIEVAKIAANAKELGARNGERYGREREIAHIHELLGVNKIADALGELKTIEAFVRDSS